MRMIYVYAEKNDTEGMAKAFITAIERFGLYITENPITEGTDSFGYIITDEPLNKKED